MAFSFYMVKSEYCEYLRKSDPCIPYTMEKKSTRPFVGIVFSIENFNYFAPLSSPKAKHLHMKNQIDFLKINNGKWGAINFNNMIPVPESCLRKIETNISDKDYDDDIKYKNLLRNQLTWCNSNKDTILRRAEKMYNMVLQGKVKGNLLKRCCNFAADERLCLKYMALQTDEGIKI